MSSNHINEIVDNVSHSLDVAKTDSDQVQALEKFQQEVKQDLQGKTPEQIQAYMPQLTKALENSNQLPVLSVAFADQLGGNLSENDLRAEERAANRASRNGDSSAQVDKVFLKYLTDNYDKGAELIRAHNDNWFWKDSNISKDDITDKLAQFRKDRDDEKHKHANQEAAAEVLDKLTASGDKSLFNFIDRNDKDGWVTKKELQKYLDDASSSGSSDGQFTQDKQKLVSQILKDWDDKDRGKWMRGGFGDIYVEDALNPFDMTLAAGRTPSPDIEQEPESSKKIEIDQPPVKAAESSSSSEPSAEGDVIPKPAKEQPKETEPNIAEPTDKKSDDAVKGSDETHDGKKDAGDSDEESNSEPNQMEVKKGDSYWRIAARVLGDAATPREILEKMNELQELNDNKPLIFFPGHPQTIKLSAAQAEAQASADDGSADSEIPDQRRNSENFDPGVFHPVVNKTPPVISI